MNEENKNKVNVSGHPITALELLCIVLLVLKVTGLVDMSWGVVLTPIWGPLALAAILFISSLLGGLVCGLYKSWKERRNAGL